MMLLSIVFITIYCVFMLIMIIQWSSIPLYIPNKCGDTLVSVLIPVRNEAQYIKKLIHSISHSQGVKNFEIIVVDDHSDDQTSEIVTALMKIIPCLRLCHLPEGSEGKKAGILFGVQQAKGGLIVCTDGDSLVPPTWLAAHLFAFEKGAKLSFGSVTFQNISNFWSIRLLSLELHSLVAIGGATLQMGKPTMINGCNYAFDRAAFIAVGGFDGNANIPTGDDEFLLRKISARYPNKIKFIKLDLAEVVTQAPSSLSQFVNQRVRWASKWRHHQDLISKLLPIGLFIGYTLILFCLWEIFIQRSELAAALLLIKLCFDIAFVCFIEKVKFKWVTLFDAVVLQFVYPFYVLFIGLKANFGTYLWRDRKFRV